MRDGHRTARSRTGSRSSGRTNINPHSPMSKGRSSRGRLFVGRWRALGRPPPPRPTVSGKSGALSVARRRGSAPAAPNRPCRWFPASPFVAPTPPRASSAATGAGGVKNRGGRAGSLRSPALPKISAAFQAGRAGSLRSPAPKTPGSSSGGRSRQASLRSPPAPVSPRRGRWPARQVAALPRAKKPRGRLNCLSHSIR